jgi:hypothetical protein
MVPVCDEVATTPVCDGGGEEVCMAATAIAAPVSPQATGRPKALSAAGVSTLAVPVKSATFCLNFFICCSLYIMVLRATLSIFIA